MVIHRSPKLMGLTVIAIGVAHPLHLVAAAYRYNEVTDDETAFAVGVTVTALISLVLLASGSVLVAFRHRGFALITIWTYSSLMTMGVMLSAGLGAYTEKPLLLGMQLLIVLTSIAVAIMLSRNKLQKSSGPSS